jgi:hypothetical protein
VSALVIIGWLGPDAVIAFHGFHLDELLGIKVDGFPAATGAGQGASLRPAVPLELACSRLAEGVVVDVGIDPPPSPVNVYFQPGVRQVPG